MKLTISQTQTRPLETLTNGHLNGLARHYSNWYWRLVGKNNGAAAQKHQDRLFAVKTEKRLRDAAGVPPQVSRKDFEAGNVKSPCAVK